MRSPVSHRARLLAGSLLFLPRRAPTRLRPSASARSTRSTGSRSGLVPATSSASRRRVSIAGSTRSFIPSASPRTRPSRRGCPGRTSSRSRRRSSSSGSTRRCARRARRPQPGRCGPATPAERRRRRREPRRAMRAMVPPENRPARLLADLTARGSCARPTRRASCRGPGRLLDEPLQRLRAQGPRPRASSRLRARHHPAADLRPLRGPAPRHREVSGDALLPGQRALRRRSRTTGLRSGRLGRGAAASGCRGRLERQGPTGGSTRTTPAS